VTGSTVFRSIRRARRVLALLSAFVMFAVG
jgi:hypothetical protein